MTSLHDPPALPASPTGCIPGSTESCCAHAVSHSVCGCSTQYTHTLWGSSSRNSSRMSSRNSTTGCSSQATSYSLQGISCRPQATSYSHHATSYSQVVEPPATAWCTPATATRPHTLGYCTSPAPCVPVCLSLQLQQTSTLSTPFMTAPYLRHPSIHQANCHSCHVTCYSH